MAKLQASKVRDSVWLIFKVANQTFFFRKFFINIINVKCIHFTIGNCSQFTEVRESGENMWINSPVVMLCG